MAAALALCALPLHAAPDDPRPGRFENLLKGEEEVLDPLEQLTERQLLVEQEIEDGTRAIAELDEQIAEARRRLLAVQSIRKARRGVLRLRVRQMYKLSRGGWVRLVLNAREGEDRFALLSAASLVLRRDVRELALYQAEQERHRGEEAKLKERRELQRTWLGRLAARRRDLEAYKRELQEKLAELRASRRRQQALHRALSSREQALLRRVVAREKEQAAGQSFAARKGTLPHPVHGYLVGRFGQVQDLETRVELLRRGLTYRTGPKAMVRAVADGVVRVAGPVSGYGRLVLIEHPGNFFTIYAFLRKITVSLDESVQRGQALGQTGLDILSGLSGLYFELRHGSRPLDPQLWLRR